MAENALKQPGSTRNSYTPQPAGGDSKQEEEEEEEIQKEETQPSPEEVTQRGAQEDPENLD